MKRIATVIVYISTAIIIAIIVGAIIWVAASLASYPAGEAVFIGLFGLTAVLTSSWIGVRIGNHFVRQNREWVERHRQPKP